MSRKELPAKLRQRTELMLLKKKKKTAELKVPKTTRASVMFTWRTFGTTWTLATIIFSSVGVSSCFLALQSWRYLFFSLRGHSAIKPRCVALQMVVRCILFAFIFFETCPERDWVFAGTQACVTSHIDTVPSTR